MDAMKTIDIALDPQVTSYQAHWQRALPWSGYLAVGTAAQRERWLAQYAAVTLPAPLRLRLAGFARRMHLLVLAGIRCGDCVREGAMLRRIADACPEIELRFLDRDSAPELRDRLRVAGGARMPATLVLSEDFEYVDRLGDRTLATYRRMLATQAGPGCPGGALADADEIAGALTELVDRLERAQLLLRLTPRLRMRHGD
jgi:hypothetical protein